MKDSKILLLLSILILITFLIDNSKNKLDTGDIAFTSYNSKNNDSFSIVLLKDIAPNTTIFFTDDEWNGNRFGTSENNLAWNSGTTMLPAFTEINFTNIKYKPNSNYGFTIGNLNLSQEGDAIFAYIGESFKQPLKFLSAISNDPNQYGTLINTNLEEGRSAITLPMNTYSAILKEKIKSSKEEIIEQLNDSNNYNFQYRTVSFASKSF
ncbi:hypothetical protein [Winogradskyella pulchriflava]|uniref:Uncharacterized protein n=1 Tax=Winogradskyella pulchriflava TaxID=1110688 RepID=A0ABV6Q822_9FLAO